MKSSFLLALKENGTKCGHSELKAHLSNNSKNTIYTKEIGVLM